VVKKLTVVIPSQMMASATSRALLEELTNQVVIPSQMMASATHKIIKNEKNQS
jgi:hypothetical protein